MTEPSKTRKITTRTIYYGGTKSLEFVRVSKVPGFSHRVVIDGWAKDWLSVDFKPSRQVAAFFLRKQD